MILVLMQTCRDYSVFVGFQHLYQDFPIWLERTTGVLAHGRLFQSSRVTFAAGLGEVAPGVMSANPKIRDINPEQFLGNLIWNQRERHQSLLFEHSDNQRIARFVSNDENARIFAMQGAWVLELFRRRSLDDATLCRQAERLAKQEAAFLSGIRKTGGSDAVCISLANAIQNCAPLMRLVQDRVRPNVHLRPAIAIQLRDLTGLRDFIDRLNSAGVDTSAIGALPNALPGELRWVAPDRILASA